MKKKLINLLLILSMSFAVVGFVGCDDDKGEDTQSSVESTISSSDEESTSSSSANGSSEESTSSSSEDSSSNDDDNSEEPPETEHTHAYASATTTPTCTEHGYTTYTCTCGDTYVADYVNAKGHSYTNYLSDGNATYEADGTKTAICDNGCGSKDTVTDVGTKLSYFSFVEYGDGYALQRYTGSSEVVKVPATYNGKNVIAIGTLPTTTTIDDLYISGNGFYENTTVKEIILPNTIKAINVGAFAYSSVAKINIPTGCRVIYDYAFYSCANLSTVIFEGSIFTEPFDGCNVTDIVVKEAATYTDGVFSEFNNLQRLTVDSLNTTAKALFKTELGETIPGSTSYATATIYSESQMYPEKVNSYTYNNNTFGIPVSYCNWYYYSSTKTINGVTMTYDGNPGVVTEWEKHYEVTVGVTYYIPASATFTFYVSTDDQYTGDTYLMPTNFEKLTITEQLFSVNDEKLADCPFAIDYEKHPVSAIEVVGETSFYPDDFDYADYQVKLTRSDNSYEFTPLRQEYLSIAHQNLLKTSGEHTLTVTYDGVSCHFNVAILFYDFEGYVFDSQDFICDGTEKSLEATNLPDGTSVTYHNNGQTAVGEYTVTATLTKQNYNEKTISATLRIFEPTYSITYVMGRENVVNSNPDVYNYGETLDLLAPICNGYAFVGWYLDSNFTQTITQITAGEYGQKTLYARWSVNTYTVSFTSGTGYTISATKNGQNFISGDKITVEDTLIFTLTATTGYTKTTLKASGNNRTFANNTLSNVYENITISGGATANQYTLSFIHDGEELSSKLVTYGSTYGTLPTITKTGYTLGWYTASTGGTKVTSSTTVNTASSHTLYARWTINSYTLTGKSSDENIGKVTGGGVYQYNTSVTLTATQCLGYDFVGWYNNSLLLSNNSTYTFTMPAKDLTITAKWQVKEEMKIFTFSSSTTTCKITDINDTSVTQITVPSIVTDISSLALSNCGNIESITVEAGNAVYHSENDCLIKTSTKTLIFGCKNSIIPNDGSVTRIDSYAFSGRANLQTVTIPNSITSMGTDVFRDCTGLTNINFNATAMSTLALDSDVFISAGTSEKGITVTIGANVTKIPAYLFYKAKNIVRVIFEEGSVCTNINSQAFSGCSGLTSVAIGNNVTSIGLSAFSYCSSLTSITIPESVRYIGAYAFANCGGLTNINFNAAAMNDDLSSIQPVFDCTGTSEKGITVTIGANVTKIPTYLFYRANNIKGVIFEEGSVCTSIGSYAFYYCSSLKSITIPDSVTEIGKYAFYGYKSLTSITFEDTSTWYRTSDSSYTGGSQISVTDPSANANYLTNAYAYYYWYKE